MPTYKITPRRISRGSLLSHGPFLTSYRKNIYQRENGFDFTPVLPSRLFGSGTFAYTGVSACIFWRVEVCTLSLTDKGTLCCSQVVGPLSDSAWPPAVTLASLITTSPFLRVIRPTFSSRSFCHAVRSAKPSSWRPPLGNFFLFCCALAVFSSVQSGCAQYQYVPQPCPNRVFICAHWTCVRPFGTYSLSAVGVLATDAGEKEVASVSALRQMKVFMIGDVVVGRVACWVWSS